MEYLIFDSDYLDIPFQDMPEMGDLIVCHDPQKRLNSDETEITWAVVEVRADDGKAPPLARGLFWEKKDAVFFAKNLCAHANNA